MRRSAKCHSRVITHFLYVAILNSHILYRIYHKKTREDPNFALLDYIVSLSQQLTQHNPPQVAEQDEDEPAAKWVCRSGRDRILMDPSRLIGMHTPVHCAASKTVDGVKVTLDTRRKCVWCQTKTKATFLCAECNVGLHIGDDFDDNCWLKYHSQNDL